jgi:DNA-binding beta-propeller fold protein YncE
MRRLTAIVALALLPATARAEILLPAGFSAQVYVTGEGFDATGSGGFAGVPSASTLALDDGGSLYLARTGRRYFGGEADDLWPIWRIPAGGARLSRLTEARYFHGPPLLNAQVTAVRGGRELLVTTFDRDRKIGVLYRVLDGRAELLAGGTPPAGGEPLLTQPEGVAVDAGGNLYVADRAKGVVVKLDPSGRVLDPRWLAVPRPRLVAAGEGEHVWVVSDGTAEAPWQQGAGEILRVGPGGAPRVLLRGPVPAAIALSPGGRLLVADRRAAKIFVLDDGGGTRELASFSDGDAPRGMAFAPVTPETRRAGLAGDLFVVVIRRGAFQVNEVVRVSGPFDAHLRPVAGQ